MSTYPTGGPRPGDEPGPQHLPPQPGPSFVDPTRYPIAGRGAGPSNVMPEAGGGVGRGYQPHPPRPADPEAAAIAGAMYPRKRRVWPWVLAGVLTLACCGGGVVMLAAGGAVDDAITAVEADASTAAGAGDQADADPSPSSRPAKRSPATTIADDGSYEVGADIAAGRYRTDGPRPGLLGLCTWEIRSADGEFVDGFPSQGQAYMPQAGTLRKGQVVRVNGCEPWQRVD